MNARLVLGNTTSTSSTVVVFDGRRRTQQQRMTAFFEHHKRRTHHHRIRRDTKGPPLKGFPVSVRSEIRTGDGNSKAARVLGLSLSEATDERKLKRAYRRRALKTHPDTGGTSASTEAFQEVQKAYRTLRLEIASPNNDALTAEISEDDEEWEEHDWRWKVKYEKEKALDRNVNATSQKKREEAFWRVREMKRMAKMKEEGVKIPAAAAGGAGEGGGGEGEGNLFPSRANKKKKRVIKPISQQSSPMENFQKVQEAEKERLRKEAEAKEKRIHFKAVGGPDASKSSTNAAHDTLNTQLKGLRRKHVLRSRYGNHANTPSEEEREKAKSIRKYQLELEDSEEERFMRLARMAKDWRDKKAGVHTWRDTGSMSDDDKMTPRELLLAAVESVSLGGSQ